MKRPRIETVADFVWLIGLGMVTLGTGMIYIPAAPIVAGCGLMILAIIMARPTNAT